MDFSAFGIFDSGCDIWTALIELACDAELCPDLLEEELEARSAALASCAEWIQSEQWDDWELQAQRLLKGLEDTLEGCLFLLDDGDLEAACDIWQDVRRRVLNLEEDIIERPIGLLDMTA